MTPIDQPQTTKNRSEVRLNYAWLITWMGTEPWANPGDWRSVMAIIDGRRSERFIKDVMWLLGVRATNSAYGMAYYANRRKGYGLPYRFGAGIVLAHGTEWLYARHVRQLRVIRDDHHETLHWTEPDWIGNHPETFELAVFEKGRERSVTRRVDEKLGAEPFHRRMQDWSEAR